MSSNNNEIMLGDAIKELLKNRNFDVKIDEIKLQEIFANTFGQHISKHLISMRFKKNVLIINLDSAALKHELSLTASKLKDVFNNKLGSKRIEKIVFI